MIIDVQFNTNSVTGGSADFSGSARAAAFVGRAPDDAQCERPARAKEIDRNVRATGATGTEKHTERLRVSEARMDKAERRLHLQWHVAAGASDRRRRENFFAFVIRCGTDKKCGGINQCIGHGC